MKAGDEVQILPEYQDAGDKDVTFIIKSMDNFPRIQLQVLEQMDMPIIPTYTVQDYMIKRVKT